MSSNFVYSNLYGTCTCSTGPYNATTNNCNVCGTGLYYNGKVCASCGVSNCQSCTKSGVCSVCVSNFTLQSNGQCGCPGALLNGTFCLKCSSN